nr:hypothetical protein [Enterococcus faecalis]
MTDKIPTEYVNLVSGTTTVNGEKVGDNDVWKDNVLNVKQTIKAGESVTITFKVKTIKAAEGQTIANVKELEVTADFSKVDFSKAGTYEVTLQTTDGQTKTVKLVIKENKQSISGSDFSMYVGDKTPTVSDFKATATDKDGTSCFSVSCVPSSRLVSVVS